MGKLYQNRKVGEYVAGSDYTSDDDYCGVLVLTVDSKVVYIQPSEHVVRTLREHEGYLLYKDYRTDKRCPRWFYEALEGYSDKLEAWVVYKNDTNYEWEERELEKKYKPCYNTRTWTDDGYTTEYHNKYGICNSIKLVDEAYKLHLKTEIETNS